MSLKSVPFAKEVTTNFAKPPNGKNTFVSPKNPAFQYDGGFDEPTWNHQKSFYQTDSTSPETPAISRPVSHNTGADYRPQQSLSPSPPGPRVKQATGSDVSLGNFIDVFVDDKFYKSHNVHYGPAVIHVNGDSPGGTPSLSGHGLRSSTSSSGRSGNDSGNVSPYFQDSVQTNPYASSPIKPQEDFLRPRSIGVNTVQIGGDSSADYRLTHSHSISPPSSPAIAKSVAFSPASKHAGNFTYGPIPTAPSLGGRNTQLTSSHLGQTPTGNAGRGQVISIGIDGLNSLHGGRTENAKVSFSTEPMQILSRGDGSPVEIKMTNSHRM